ncbi:hypothetical protein F4810DRAFT_413280 [Camillea tinctor]|nr:hypothetical protein F4810DRAFT_413280 [Camillea tinctor]
MGGLSCFFFLPSIISLLFLSCGSMCDWWHRDRFLTGKVQASIFSHLEDFFFFLKNKGVITETQVCTLSDLRIPNSAGGRLYNPRVFCFKENSGKPDFKGRVLFSVFSLFFFSSSSSLYCLLHFFPSKLTGHGGLSSFFQEKRSIAAKFKRRRRRFLFILSSPPGIPESPRKPTKVLKQENKIITYLI